MKQTLPPKAIVVTICDRCEREVRTEIDDGEEASLPEGWVEVAHPNGVDPMLTFDRRACTSQWFRAWVRRLYDVPEPKPRRRKKDRTQYTPSEVAALAKEASYEEAVEGRPD